MEREAAAIRQDKRQCPCFLALSPIGAIDGARFDDPPRAHGAKFPRFTGCSGMSGRAVAIRRDAYDAAAAILADGQGAGTGRTLRTSSPTRLGTACRLVAEPADPGAGGRNHTTRTGHRMQPGGVSHLVWFGCRGRRDLPARLGDLRASVSQTRRLRRPASRNPTEEVADLLNWEYRRRSWGRVSFSLSRPRRQADRVRGPETDQAAAGKDKAGKKKSVRVSV